MKFLKYFAVITIVVTLFMVASSNASAQPRFRGGFFFHSRPMYYDYYGPVYRPAPLSFDYYRGRPNRGFGLNFSRGGFGFTYESNRGRRRNRCDDDRRGNRRGSRRSN